MPRKPKPLTLDTPDEWALWEEFRPRSPIEEAAYDIECGPLGPKEHHRP